VLVVTPYAFALSLVTSVPVGLDPEEVGVEEDANKIFVASENDDTCVIDGAADTIIDVDPSDPDIDCIQSANMPFGIGVNSLTDRAYVSGIDDNAVFVINTNDYSVIDQNLGTLEIDGIQVGTAPRGVAVDEVLNKVISANEFADFDPGDPDTASVIDIATNTKTDVTVGEQPFSVEVDDILHKAYVTNAGDPADASADTVSVIDLNVNPPVAIATIPVGDRPGGTAGGIGVNSVTHKGYVCNTNDSTISVINTATDTEIDLDLSDADIDRIPVVSCFGIGVNEVTNRIYVSGFNVVSVIDGVTDTVIGSPLALPDSRRGVDVNPITGKIYVAGNDEVFVLTDAPVTPELPEMILKCYVVIEDPPPVDPPAVTLVDQFGTEVVDPGVTQRICEEGLKHSTIAPNNPRHWKQYEYVGTRETGQFELKDQFGTEVVGPAVSFDLLVPALKNEESPPNLQHWTSYGIAGTIDPAPIQVADQFGNSTIDLGNPVSFFSNTFKNGVGLAEGQDMKCYNIDNEDPIIDPGRHIYVDQFGESIVDPSPADFLCVIAQKSLIPETPVGGELLTVQFNSLFVAGVYANAFWIVPTLVGVIGAAVVTAVIRIRGRKTS
jgi:DNA-binding beta-propeller fold protein YncE